MSLTKKEYQLFINGSWVKSSTKETQDIINPAYNSVIAQAQKASADDVKAAVDSARDAFDKGPWKDSTPQQRGRMLFKIAELIRENKKMLAELETKNNGKPIAESEWDVDDSATVFEYYGGMATKIFGDVNPVPDNALNITLKEPVGVCGQIVPFNYPLLLATWKVAPALAAGCTVILKPSTPTPLTVLELAKLMQKIELPKGVVNVITGSGDVVGSELAKSDKVDKIAFTGSTETGRNIMKMAAESNLKKVTLELGGKSPNIFFTDAAFENAVDGALFGVFINQGEVCSAGSRILVHESIKDKLVEAMCKKAENITVGDGMDRKTKMGPLVNEAQYKRVQNYIELGQAEGAKMMQAGKVTTKAKGFFVKPTIFDNVTTDMKIHNEEIFGPVVSITPFKDEQEAIELANKTKYGLAAAVWTRDIFKALRMVKKIRAGIVWVNHMQPSYVEAPWGGFKQSGMGRELGKYGIEGYLECKQVHINLNEERIGWYG